MKPLKLDHCIYCDSKICLIRDHVIPLSYTHTKRQYKNTYHVTACVECNGILSDHMYITVASRAEYLLTQYRIKYKQWLEYEPWTKKELSTMSYMFQEMIKKRLILRKSILSRIERLSYVAVLGEYIEMLDKHGELIESIVVDSPEIVQYQEPILEHKVLAPLIDIVPTIEPIIEVPIANPNERKVNTLNYKIARLSLRLEKMIDKVSPRTYSLHYDIDYTIREIDRLKSMRDSLL